MLTIDRAMNMRVPASDVIALRYRWLLSDGTPSEMLGEVWAFVIWGPGMADIVAKAGPVDGRFADEDGPYFEMRHEPTVGALLAGKVGLRWKVAEVLPTEGGEPQLDTRYEGLLTVDRSPAAAGVTAPALGEGEILMLIDEEND